MSAGQASPYVCDPPLFLPPSIPAKGITYYVIFAPDEYAGVYLSWYHLAAVMRSCGVNTRSLDQQGFTTPQSALASWRGTCSITHRHRRPPPSPQGLVFCEENVRWFLAHCDCNGVFNDPDAASGDVGYDPQAGHEPPHSHSHPTTAPRTPPPSPPPTPAATRAATSATSRAYTQPSAATRAPTAAASSRYYTAASGATSAASTSRAAPAASRSRSGAPSAPGPSSRSARSTTSSVSASSVSGSDVVSWLDATASAMADLDLRSDTTGPSEHGNLQAVSNEDDGHRHRYVVYADGVAPEIVRHWKTAFDRLLELKAEGRRDAKISQRPSLAKAERLVKRLTGSS
ncbi:hypothetical protein GGF50DRAFT_92318 [Schizophyllum commune]